MYCFVRATGIFSSSILSRVVPLAAFRVLSDLLASHSSLRAPASRLGMFILFCFSSSFSSLFLFCFPVFIFFRGSGFFCCALVPGTLAFYSLYLDELRSVWFTLFHSLYISSMLGHEDGSARTTGVLMSLGRNNVLI